MVVHNHDFQVDIGLTENRSESGSKIPLFVVAGMITESFAPLADPLAGGSRHETLHRAVATSTPTTIAMKADRQQRTRSEESQVGPMLVASIVNPTG